MGKKKTKQKRQAAAAVTPSSAAATPAATPSPAPSEPPSRSDTRPATPEREAVVDVRATATAADKGPSIDEVAEVSQAPVREPELEPEPPAPAPAPSPPQPHQPLAHAASPPPAASAEHVAGDLGALAIDTAAPAAPPVSDFHQAPAPVDDEIEQEPAVETTTHDITPLPHDDDGDIGVSHPYDEAGAKLAEPAAEPPAPVVAQEQPPEADDDGEFGDISLSTEDSNGDMSRTLFANGKAAHTIAADRLDESLTSRRTPLLPPLELAQRDHNADPTSPTSPLVSSRRSLTQSPVKSTGSRPLSLAFSPPAGTRDPASPRSYQSPAARVLDTLPALTVPDSPPPQEFASPNEAPFESISLDAESEAAPPPQTLQTVPADPSAKPTRHVKHESWGGYGIDSHGKPEAHGVLPVHPDPPASSAGTSTAGASTAATPETRASLSISGSGTSTPRRHAPPAHPHPFPLPTSPTKPNVPVPQVTSLPSGHSGAGTPAVAMPPTGHGLGAKGASTLDKFISRTRPQHLPPKDKTEDEIHLHEWESMMAKSREHEAERRKREAAVRLEKERRLQAVTPRWEALLANDFSVQKVRTNPIFRKLWFDGCPEHLRGKAWSLAIGNNLSLHKDAYKTYSARAARAIEQGRFPQDILDQIDKDLDDTLPTLHIFQQGSPIRDDLRELLCTWVVYRSDSGLGYAPYVNLLAAMFIIVSPPPVAFISLVNFLARPCLNSFSANDTEEIDAFYRVFENLQADQFPKIYANCKNLGLRLPESYFRSVLVEQVPFAAACRLWDQIVLDGDGYIFRAALAIFGFLEPRLYYPDREEILSVLEGRNAATKAITEREIERARLRGEEYEDSLDGKLSVFGLTEGALFDWLEHDGWRDSRFERLVIRELPD